MRTLITLAIALLLVGCGKDAEPEPNPFVATDTGVLDVAPVEDSMPADAVVDTGPPTPTDCFMNPKTHFEIINACTKATMIKRTPKLPLLLPDGGLPSPP